MPLNTLSTFRSIIPLLSASNRYGETTLTVSYDQSLFSLTCLRFHINYQYKLLSCISGIDLINSKYRFAVVYDLLSISINSRMRLKIFVNEITSVMSIIEIFQNAN